MSPAAATRMVVVTELVIPAGSVPRTPKQGTTDPSYVLADERDPTRADRDDEAAPPLHCAKPRSSSCSEAGSPPGRAAGRPPTTTSTSTSARRTPKRALAALEATGMRIERPPEEWLYKAYDGATLVDLIFRPAGGPIDDEHFEPRDEHGGRRADAARRLDRRRPRHEAARAHRAGAELPVPCSSSRGRCASRSTGTSSARARADSPFAQGVLHARRGARHRRARPLAA